MLTVLTLAFLLAEGPAFAQAGPQDAASPSPQNSIKLTRVLADMPAGTPYMTIKSSKAFCLGGTSRTWVGGRQAQQVSPFATPFKTGLEGAGYKVVTPGEDNLFDEEGSTADYEAAAVITDEHVDACMIVLSGLLGSMMEKGDVRGSASMTVDWQIYSRLKKQVVAHVTTTGSSEISHAVQGGAQQLALNAFAENVRQLAGNADFRAAMAAPKAFTAGFQMPGQQTHIVLAGSLKAGPRKIADATGSVVTVLTSTGSGSGFLVSADGYFLTDAHVVGDDKTVRIRWPDGLEGLATVERAIKNRDVAILKANPRGRAPLALRRGPVTPGDRVYVIGSPNGKNFEGTVSSGVISADRTIDGLRYIQSDAAMSPGSSGGPLLDEKGEVIGLSEMLYFNQGQVAGLNLFTPIGDAMDFLALEQK
jgi:S1-C subfamily serine protease